MEASGRDALGTRPKRAEVPKQVSHLPEDTGQYLGTSVIVTTGGAPGTEWVGVRDAAQPPQCPGHPKCQHRWAETLLQNAEEKHLYLLPPEVSITLYTARNGLFPNQDLSEPNH